MALQVIKDGQGGNIGIFVPMNDWNTITQKYEGLKELVDVTAGVDAFLPVWQIEPEVAEPKNNVPGNN
jgi:hypothetical protein